MRLIRVFAFICLLLAGLPVAATAGLSMPVTWQARGWIFRYQPADEPFFMDGGVIATVDLVAWDGDALRVLLYVGAGLTINMGLQEEDVVFDPRDAHYSLIGGLRFETSTLMGNVEFLHDCFHDIDRYDESTEVWNAGKFDFYNRNWFPRYRRENWKDREGRGLIYDAGYYATFWFFPRWGANEYVQHDHDINTLVGGGLKLAFAHWNNNAVELRPNIEYYYRSGGEWAHRNNVLLYLTHYGSGGTAALFAGPQWDNQPIKPSGDRWIFGLDFYL
jgi:hypothetical protein